MNDDRQLLWSVSNGETTTICVMVSCCAGAELQLVRSTEVENEQIVLRELYPDKEALYERARELKSGQPSVSLSRS